MTTYNGPWDKIAGWLDIALAAKLRASNNATNPVVQRAYADEAAEIQNEILQLRKTQTPLEAAIAEKPKK